MRKIDITEKLNFEDNPKLVIRGEEYEVNSDALAMLKTMQLMTEDEPTPKEIVEAYEAIFNADVRKRLESLNLKFGDFNTLLDEAVKLITGTDGQNQGE